MIMSTSLCAQLTYANFSDTLSVGLFGGLTDCIVDMNGDYLDDVVIMSTSKMVVHYQQEDGTYEHKIFNWNFNSLPSWSICAGDFNEDGFNDLVLGDYGSVSFFMSLDNGESYVEETFPDYIFAQRSTASDIDQDGHLDAFVCNDDAQNHVFHNMGGGKMAMDISLLPTEDLAGNYANLWTDYDNDGDQDLFITKCFVYTTSVDDPERINLLYQNNGDGTFTEVGASANMNDNAQSWITSMEDFDNDGDFDAFIANHDFANRFMLNNGDGTFTDIIDSTGIDKTDLGAWQSFAGDFNNDGFVDILLDTERKMYINNGDLTFSEVIIPFGEYNRGAVGDLNNDGHLDFIMKEQAWVNTSKQGNWLKVNLKGIESNSNGIGARVELHGAWGMQSREIRSGESYSSMSHLNAHFGIGEATAIEKLVIKWPSGKVSTIENPPINSTQMVLEYQCAIPTFPIAIEGDFLCPGDELIITAPEEFESYTWSTGETTTSITITEPGTYSLDVLTDEGCFGTTGPLVIENSQPLSPSLSHSGILEICAGETITLTEEAGLSDVYWNIGSYGNSITVSEAGEYFVETTDACNGEKIYSDTVLVNVIEVFTPIVSDYIVSPGESITLTAEGTNLVWFENEIGGLPIAYGPSYTTSMIDIETTYFVANLTTGETGLTCESERVPVAVSLSSTEEIIQEFGIEIYPNPASTNLFIDIDSPADVQKVELLNSLGQKVSIIADHQMGQRQLVFDLALLESGTYTVKLTTTKGTASKNIIVVR